MTVVLYQLPTHGQHVRASSGNFYLVNISPDIIIEAARGARDNVGILHATMKPPSMVVRLPVAPKVFDVVAAWEMRYLTFLAKLAYNLTEASLQSWVCQFLGSLAR